MGIEGLLPALKTITKSVTLERYRNQTVAVDAYVWLHRAVLSAGYDIQLGKPKEKYVWVCTKWLDLFASFGVTPYLVFDGRKLPSKLVTEKERLKRRSELRVLAQQHLQQGRLMEAEECFKKATDISPEIAYKFIEVIQKRNLPYVVAPYESDAQLAFLARNGHVSAVVTEDSDLLVFECPKVLYKLDYEGNCSEISYSDISKVPYLDGIIQKSKDKFRHHCILSGCDYLPSVKGIGLKKAAKVFQSAHTYLQAIRQLRNNSTYVVPPNYEKDFFRADLTFRYQWVYDPTTKLIVNLTTPDINVPITDMKFLGERITDPYLVSGLVSGRLDPDTFEPVTINNDTDPGQKSLMSFYSKPNSNQNNTVSRTNGVSSSSSNHSSTTPQGTVANPQTKPATTSTKSSSSVNSNDSHHTPLNFTSPLSELSSPTNYTVPSTKPSIVTTPTHSRHFQPIYSQAGSSGNQSSNDSTRKPSVSSSQNITSTRSTNFDPFPNHHRVVNSLDLSSTVTQSTNLNYHPSNSTIPSYPLSSQKSISDDPRFNSTTKPIVRAPFKKEIFFGLKRKPDSTTTNKTSIESGAKRVNDGSNRDPKFLLPSQSTTSSSRKSSKDHMEVDHLRPTPTSDSDLDLDSRAVLWEAVRQTSASTSDQSPPPNLKNSSFLERFRCDRVIVPPKPPSATSNSSDATKPTPPLRMASTLLQNRYVQSLTLPPNSNSNPPPNLRRP